MSIAHVTLKRGGLYVSGDLYDRVFAGLESIILLRRDDDLLMLPVRHAAAGGYLLKRRNAAGDRLVSAPDFFRQNGLEPDLETTRELPVIWRGDLAGLVAENAFRLQT